MDSGVTVLMGRPDPLPPHRGAGSRWAGLALLVAGLAGGYLLAPGGSRSAPVDDTTAVAAVAPPSNPADPIPSGAAPDGAVGFPGTILASVEFGRGLVTWPGRGDPVTIRLASSVEQAAYDAKQERIAVTVPEYDGTTMALHIGRLGDLRMVAAGVTGFAWHPTDTNAIAWVEDTAAGYRLVSAVVGDTAVTATGIVVLGDRALPVAWGDWGFALEGDGGLTTVDPAGTVIATSDVQFVAAGSDGRLVVAIPAGTPLSRDWALTGLDLTTDRPLGRFADLDEHPTAAAVLPTTGRIVLVSNRFGDRGDLARIEILAPDGSSEAVIRSGMIAESIAWSPDETRLAIGGYYYGADEVRSVVLLTDADGAGEIVEVPFDHQVRPLGIRP